MTTSAVAHELVELAHDLARAVSEHDVDRLESARWPPSSRLQGAAGQLDREAFLEAASGAVRDRRVHVRGDRPRDLRQHGGARLPLQPGRAPRRPRPHAPDERDGHLDAPRRPLADRPPARDGGRLMTTPERSLTRCTCRPPSSRPGCRRFARRQRTRVSLELIVRRPAVEEREVARRGRARPRAGARRRLLAVARPLRRAAREHEGADHASRTRALRHSSRGERDRWPLAGDQLYVDFDLSGENLPPGSRLAIGWAVLEVTDEPHTGCKKFTRALRPRRARVRQLARGPRAQPARHQHPRRAAGHDPRRRRRPQAVGRPSSPRRAPCASRAPRKLPAGRGDIASAREADGRGHTRTVELRLECGDRVARLPVVHPRRVVASGLAARRRSSLRCQSVAVVSQTASVAASPRLADPAAFRTSAGSGPVPCRHKSSSRSVSSTRFEMKSLDASGEGWSAASADTQSRQYFEQKLLVDERSPCAPDSEAVSRLSSSSA